MNSGFDAGIRRRMVLAREAARYTIKEAAEAVGMTRQKLSRIENGESSPTLEEFRELCILFGVTPAYILMGANIHPAIGRAMKAASSAANVSS